MGGEDDHIGIDPLLDQEAMVYTPDTSVPLQALSSLKTSESYPRGVRPSTSRSPPFEGMEVERQRLEELGCSHNVIQTLLHARKHLLIKHTTKSGKNF